MPVQNFHFSLCQCIWAIFFGFWNLLFWLPLDPLKSLHPVPPNLLLPSFYGIMQLRSIVLLSTAIYKACKNLNPKVNYIQRNGAVYILQRFWNQISIVYKIECSWIHELDTVCHSIQQIHSNFSRSSCLGILGISMYICPKLIVSLLYK